jgi:2-polyprenyl-6-hydroxyphenyl methylase/3-demethylubiquinone-9 3-methyltransferase
MFRLSALALGFLATTAFGQANPPASPPPASSPAKPKAVAVVNGREISEAAVERALKPIAPANREKARKDVINFLVENALVDHYLELLKVTVDPKEVDAQLDSFKKDVTDAKQEYAKVLARMGMTVIGVDPADASLQTAREHADRAGLRIDYRSGAGEQLPLQDASVDLAVCVDVLEHVEDVAAVLRETARVLRPAGLYLFDTVNRTPLSRLVMIKIGQEWRHTRWLPPNLHDWDHFVTPDELRLAARSAGLLVQEIIGVVPTPKPPAMYRLIRQLKKGALTYGEFGSRLEFKLDDDIRMGYIGYATKPAS